LVQAHPGFNAQAAIRLSGPRSRRPGITERSRDASSPSGVINHGLSIGRPPGISQTTHAIDVHGIRAAFKKL
jgi:hypothetical protein